MTSQYVSGTYPDDPVLAELREVLSAQRPCPPGELAAAGCTSPWGARAR